MRGSTVLGLCMSVTQNIIALIDVRLQLCGCLFVVSLSVIPTKHPQCAVLLNLHMRRQWHPGSVFPLEKWRLGTRLIAIEKYVPYLL